MPLIFCVICFLLMMNCSHLESRYQLECDYYQQRIDSDTLDMYDSNVLYQYKWKNDDLKMIQDTLKSYKTRNNLLSTKDIHRIDETISNAEQQMQINTCEANDIVKYYESLHDDSCYDDQYTNPIDPD